MLLALAPTRPHWVGTGRGGGGVGMGECPTPDRHVAQPTSSVGGLCRRLPCAGLGATQTTADPVRDRRSEVATPLCPGARTGHVCTRCVTRVDGRQGRGSPRQEPAHVNRLSPGRAQNLRTGCHHAGCGFRSSGPMGRECTMPGVLKTRPQPTCSSSALGCLRAWQFPLHLLV